MSKTSSAARLHDDLVDQVVAERQAGDLFDQRLVLGAEDVQLAADVLDVVLQEEDALRVAAVAGLELVQVEPFQQLLVDLQLQVGHDRPQVGLQLAAADRGGLLGLEGQRVGPDADLGARLEHARLPAQHLLLADDATIQADVLQGSLPLLHPHDGVLPRDQRALQADRVGRVAADGDLAARHLDRGCGGFR